MRDEVTFERPVKASLWVHLENGESWEAAKEDLKRFKLERPTDLYSRTEDLLKEALGIDDFRDHPVAQYVRYIIECGILYDHTPWCDGKGDPWSEESDLDGDDRLVLRRALLELDEAGHA